MNKTAQLVVKWAEYEAENRDATIEGFCQYTLTLEKEKEHQVKFAGSVVPPDLHSIMAKMTGRLAGLHRLFATKALRECGINNFDDFIYLINISTLDGPKKTQVIYANFNELSSGLLILSRLKQLGLIKESPSKEDKRAKRLFLTAKGSKTLSECYEKMALANRFFFAGMQEVDIRRSIQLLSGTESTFAERWMMDKEKPFKELMKG